MAAHRYWRIRVDSIGLDVPAASRVEFLDALNDDLTQTAGGAAIASSYYAGGYEGSRAFDNDTGTLWAGAVGPPGWIGWDFGAANDQDIASCSWTVRYDGYEGQSIYTGALEYSDDGAAWTEAYPIVADTPWGDDQRQQFFAPLPGFDDPQPVEFTGGFETFTATADHTLGIKLWAGGGHGGQYSTGRFGGGGGFVFAEFDILEGDEVSFQIGDGGKSGYGTTYISPGGYPDGGTGSWGDTYGGGGGGSSRFFINGMLRAVAGGGGASAGYNGSGGGGGGNFGTAQGGPGTTLGPYLQTYPYGWKMGRGIVEAGFVGRTGGFGGTILGGTGDDGGGGGGGFYGGGGGGGDGASGGGGANWIHSSAVSQQSVKAGGRVAAGVTDSDYPGSPVADGQVSNDVSPASAGAAVYGSVYLTPGGTDPAVPWAYAFDRPADTYGTGFQGYTARCMIPASQLTGLGDVLRFFLRGAISEGTHIDRCFVGIADQTSSQYLSFLGEPVQVFFNGGDPDVDIDPNLLQASDPFDFPLDGENWLLVSFFLDDAQATSMYKGTVPGDLYRAGYKVNDSADQTGAWAFTSLEYLQFLESVQVQVGEGGPVDPPDPDGGRRRQGLNVF